LKKHYRNDPRWECEARFIDNDEQVTPIITQPLAGEKEIKGLSTLLMNEEQSMTVLQDEKKKKRKRKQDALNESIETIPTPSTKASRVSENQRLDAPMSLGFLFKKDEDASSFTILEKKDHSTENKEIEVSHSFQRETADQLNERDEPPSEHSRMNEILPRNGPFFFFHPQHAAMDEKRLPISWSTLKRHHFFVKTENLEEIQRRWDSVKQNLTQNYKQRHKSAVRKYAKRQKSAHVS
jgi:hypothetical protein